MIMEWTLNDLRVLIEELDEQQVLAVPSDVVWLIDKLQNPQDKDQDYFKTLVDA